MGVLLKVRAAVYLVAGVPILSFTNIGTTVRAVGLVALAIAALAPFVVRRNPDWSGARVSAGADVIVSYVMWVTMPDAEGISLLLTIWAVAVVVFLSQRSTAQRFVLATVLLELSKITFIVVPQSEYLNVGDRGSAWLILVRAAAISGSYYVMRSLDRYFMRLTAAAESGSERYRRLMDAAPSSFLVVVDGYIVYANSAAISLLGGSRSALVGLAFGGLVDRGSRSAFKQQIRRAAESLQPYSIESVGMRSVEGESRIVDAAITAIEYSNELAVQVALHDISAQRQAESELRETQFNYRSFFERIPVALYRSRPTGEIIQANRALIELFGATDESEIIGVDARILYQEDDDRAHLISMLSNERIVVGYEARMKSLDGSTIWVRDTSRLIETDDGEVYEGAMVDVTGRRNIEDELWARAVQQEAAASIGQLALEAEDINQVMRSVTETVARVLKTDGSVILERDDDGDFVIVGDSGRFDLAPDSISPLADRAHMTAAPVVLRTSDEVRFAAPAIADAGISSAIAVMIPGADIEFGTLIAFSAEERVFTSEDLNFLHSIANVLAAAVDRAIANAKLEELLRSKDAFVASVSHELRTPLTVVTGMAHELNERWMDLSSDDLAEFTQLLVDQSQDMSDLIEDLLVAARANIGNVTVRNELVDLDKQVKSVLASFANSSPSPISVQIEEAVVDADPIRVRQILRNLVTNALRYGGPNIEVVMSSTAGSRVVEVIDDGDGIAPSDQERIFVAYERAHSVEGKPGSVGLGLTVSRTLAELMGGSLTYEFNGKSAFRLELARNTTAEQTRRATEAQENPVASGIAAFGSGRIGVDVGSPE
jgi:PAS domain S-box-containing protein